jgi:ABC-type arginine transport system ATPase subunit
MMPLLLGGLGRGPARKRAREVLERVGLGERLTHRRVSSRAASKRVAVARAVVTRPKVIWQTADRQSRPEHGAMYRHCFTICKELLARWWWPRTAKRWQTRWTAG